MKLQSSWAYLGDGAHILYIRTGTQGRRRIMNRSDRIFTFHRIRKTSVRAVGLYSVRGALRHFSFLDPSDPLCPLYRLILSIVTCRVEKDGGQWGFWLMLTLNYDDALRNVAFHDIQTTLRITNRQKKGKATSENQAAWLFVLWHRVPHMNSRLKPNSPALQTWILTGRHYRPLARMY